MPHGQTPAAAIAPTADAHWLGRGLETMAMNAPDIPDQEPPKRARPLHWISPIFLMVLFLLVHVAAPWGLSWPSTRYGWADGRPGPWNLLALPFVAAGIVCTLGLIALHFRASPGSFVELRPGNTC